MLRARLAAVTLLLALLAPVSLARASAYSEVLKAYEQQGSIPPCEFSSSQLSSALKGVDTYGAQYFADFTNAIKGALATRAGGACGGANAQAAPILAPAHLPPPAAHSVSAPTQSDVPAPILALAVLSGTAVLIGAAVGLAMWRGSEPRIVASSRHALGEAGYRVSASWADFRDWLRSA